MVPEGGSAKLVCKARGFPKPKITWRREDGTDVIVRGGPSAKSRGLFNYSINMVNVTWVAVPHVEGEMLTLSKVTRSEMGAYMCIAANGVPPSVSKRIQLQVHCKSSRNENSSLSRIRALRLSVKIPAPSFFTKKIFNTHDLLTLAI